MARHTMPIFVCALCILWSGALKPDEHEDSGAHGKDAAHGHGIDGHDGYAVMEAGEHEDGHGAHEGDHGHGSDAHEDGHGAHEGDHGHGSDAHGHATYDPVAGSMAMMVFGTMAFVMTLFYFVNFPDEDVRHETWGALSDMIAIFCAVLAFSALTTSLADFAETDPHAHGPPTLKALCISYGRYAVCVVVLEAVFAACKKRPWQFKYFSTILGHVTGFAAIDAFGSTLQFTVFKDSLALSWFGVLSCCVIIAVVAHGISMMTVDKAKGTHHWKHESIEVSCDYVALACGLLISLTIRMSISGVLPPVHGAPRNKDFWMVWGLFTAAILQIPLVLAASVWKYRVHNREGGASSWLLRASETIQMTTCFTAGWTLLYWGYWEFYQTQGNNDDDFGPGGKMLQRLTMAIIFSVIVFAAILAIDKVADNTDDAGLEYGFRSLLKTCSLLMGLSWEACFNEGVHAIGLEYHGSTQTLVIVLVSVTTCAIVLPAWALYILPHTTIDDFEKHFLEDHHHGHGDEHEHAEEGHKETPRHTLDRSSSVARVAKRKSTVAGHG